ncbi:MAG: hypothetical protein KKB34_10205 [Bacteroidetes bacterium]|nr:hypothetical protein [Bacteroidota bacterium]
MSEQKKIKQKDIKCAEGMLSVIFFDDKEAIEEALYIFVVNDGKFVSVSDRGQIKINPGAGIDVTVPAIANTSEQLNYKLHKLTTVGDGFLYEGKIKLTTPAQPAEQPKQEPADAKP